MLVLVTGARGQLGYDVIRELKNRNTEVVGVDIEDMDITDGESVERVVGKIKPSAVIHCAAWTAVDAAEDEANRQKVYSVNVKGTENIAAACAKYSAKMIYISTDYVFNGQGERPWEEDDKAEPLNYYGQTKYEGELAVKRYLKEYFIVRISWVFGINGKNFVKTMLNVGKTHDTVRVVNDQIGSPTYTYDLAKLLADMLESENYGTYHATNGGDFISWYDFTKEIYHLAGLNTKVIPVTTAEYGLSKAKRPSNSRMSKDKLIKSGFTPLPDWKDALQRYIEELNNAD